jgi:hypothetical protein
VSQYRAVFIVRTHKYRPVVDAFLLVDMHKVIAGEAAARLTGKPTMIGYHHNVAQSIQGMQLRTKYNNVDMYNMHLDDPMTADEVEKVIQARFADDPDGFDDWLKQFIY